MTLSQQYDYIGKDKMLALKALHSIIEQSFQLSGDISLLSNGVAEKQTGDITIVVSTWEGIGDFNNCVFARHAFDDDASQVARPCDTAAYFTCCGQSVSAHLATKMPRCKNDFLNGLPFNVSHPSHVVRIAREFIGFFEKADPLSITPTQTAAYHAYLADIEAYQKWVTKAELSEADKKVLLKNFGTVDPSLVPIALP